MKKRKKIPKIIIIVMLVMFLTSFCQSSISGIQTIGTVTSFPSGWSEDYQISNSSYAIHSNFPDIITNYDGVHAIWSDARPKEIGPGWESKLTYRRSADEGRSWLNIINLTQYNGNNVNAPLLAVVDQTIHLIWDDTRYGKREVMYRNSTDNGQSWSDEVLISPADSKYSQNPSIACSGQNVHVVWEDNRNLSTGYYNIYYKRSTDGGITWDDGLGNMGQDRQLTFSVSPSTDVGAYIAVDENGIHLIYSLWTSDFGRWETMYMKSTDNGSNWTAPIFLSEHDSWHSDPQAIAVNGSSGIHVVYWESKYGNEEIGYRNSNDNGINWNPEVRFTIDPNHSQQPDIVVNASHVFVTWMDDRDHYDWTGTPSGAFELYYKESFDSGATWSNDTRLTYAVNNSIQPCVVMNANYIHVAWTDNRTDGSREQIFYKRYPDFPDTEPPIHSNEIPFPDSYKDAPGTNVSVHVTDPSGVNESTIQLYVNGSLVSYNLSPITDGYNVSYESPGFEPGVVTCRIVADDNLSNHLDYTWNFTVLATYNSQLREGWNIISVPFVQVNTSIKEVLKDIDGKWDFIEYYDSASGEWMSYATFWPESLNEFQEINNTMAIWINITEPDVNLTVRGLISTYTEIPLKAGWNFVGYPTQTTETVGNALWGTGADRVEVFDPIDPYRLKEVGATYVMKLGEGYWVHVVADSIWTVNW